LPSKPFIRNLPSNLGVGQKITKEIYDVIYSPLAQAVCKWLINISYKKHLMNAKCNRKYKE
jgi:hypothetical protein